jgi:hypothetical protein
MVLDVIDLFLLLEDPEIIAEREVDGPRPDLRLFQRLDPDQLLFQGFSDLFPDQYAHDWLASFIGAVDSAFSAMSLKLPRSSR